MQSDSQQPAFGQLVHRHLEHGRWLQHTGDHTAHLPVVFLEDENIVGTNEGHSRWGI
jgi:hypothetical protein